MKPLLKASLLIGLAVAGMATAAYAFQAAHGFSPAVLDADRDGVISNAELDTHADQMFAHADKNRDGQLSADERNTLHAEMERAMNRPAPMPHADHQGAAPTTPAQFREGLRRHAAALDADHDGRLTVAEVSVAFQHGAGH